MTDGIFTQMIVADLIAGTSARMATATGWTVGGRVWMRTANGLMIVASAGTMTMNARMIVASAVTMTMNERMIVASARVMIRMPTGLTGTQTSMSTPSLSMWQIPAFICFKNQA